MMPMTDLQLAPGSLIKLRDREWIVIDNPRNGRLRVRPIGLGEEDATTILVGLERDIRSAEFDAPDPGRAGPSAAARMLRDALLLSLRRGAGPFRSFGRLNFDPRAYQLAPLLMSLRLETVRLLIADDVGIGKTIEAGLIARELLDRGEIRRLAVICPPHLVDQWILELKTKFSVDAVGVTAATAKRLERGLRVGSSLFDEHQFFVVSLDYIKRDERAEAFKNACPELVIVDEAHTCVGGANSGRHQRYQLLQKLSQDRRRHMLFLTATPHSGDVEAFSRLVGLISDEFRGFENGDAEQHKALRDRLGDHLIQRRRADIDAWKEPGLFPVPEVRPDVTYRLHPDASAFFDSVLDYCAEVTERAGKDERTRRLAFWGTLALMRCVASSPVAALSALRSRARLSEQADADFGALEHQMRQQAFDSDPEESVLDDDTPTLVDDAALSSLLRQAEALARDPHKDEKLKTLITEVRQLLKSGFSPVVFCRYIGTAKNVGAALEGAFPDATIGVVTGELPPAERLTRVEELGTASQRILVATDCLSEGVNLQSHFDAVVHYDLSWNPTRHQQRDGRVNRFGQKKPIVRSLIIYGADNPVDGAVLQVILRKAEDIRKATGVPVPIPDNDRAMSEALLKAVLMRRKRLPQQQPLLFDDLPEAVKIDQTWQNAAEREKRSQTIFAQRSLKPENVIPEWEQARAAIGGDAETTHRFLVSAFQRFGTPLAESDSGFRLKFPEDATLVALADRLADAGLLNNGTYTFRPGPDREAIHRTHPLVSTVGEFLLERALDPEAAAATDIATLPRSGAWFSDAVSGLTTIALLRLRHQLISQTGSSSLLAEEASAIAWTGQAGNILATGAEAFALLDHPASADLAQKTRLERLEAAQARLVAWRPAIDAHANERADKLKTDHDRVRRATMRSERTSVARVDVSPILPVDVIGLYVLIPPVT